MGKTSFRELLERGATTRPAKGLLKNIAALKAAMAEAATRGADQKYLGTLQADGRQAILRDLHAAQQEERERVRVEAEREKARYQKEYMRDLNAHVFELSSWERKCRAMTERELQSFTTSYTAGTASAEDPHELDIVSGELLTRGLVKEHAILREKMSERHADAPWERTPIGAALMREMRLNEHVSGGGILLDLDGKIGSASFDNAWEALSDEKPVQ